MPDYSAHTRPAALGRQLIDTHPRLDGLSRDHQLIAGLLDRAATLARGLDAVGTRAELDGLAAILASHFAGEERRIAGALDAPAAGELEPRW